MYYLFIPMNYIDACNILKIDTNDNISLEYLKKQYRKLALINHPDKNGNTKESNDKFQQINESYHFLLREINYTDNKDLDTSSLYFNLLQSFMKGRFNNILINIVNDIIVKGIQISSKLFDGLDKDSIFNIYNFLSNNKTTLHLSEETLDIVREIVIKKYDNVKIYKLNPSINDLLNHNLYKLYIHDELFLVPLWHNESFFEGSSCEIIVICEPELPDNITIDDDNNITIETDIYLTNNILNDGNIYVDIGDNKYEIVLSKLLIKREQMYKIKNMGLSKVKANIYDISEKMDIIFKIKLSV